MHVSINTEVYTRVDHVQNFIISELLFMLGVFTLFYCSEYLCSCRWAEQPCITLLVVLMVTSTPF